MDSSPEQNLNVLMMTEAHVQGDSDAGIDLVLTEEEEPENFPDKMTTTIQMSKLKEEEVSGDGDGDDDDGSGKVMKPVLLSSGDQVQTAGNEDKCKDGEESEGNHDKVISDQQDETADELDAVVVVSTSSEGTTTDHDYPTTAVTDTSESEIEIVAESPHAVNRHQRVEKIEKDDNNGDDDRIKITDVTLDETVVEEEDSSSAVLADNHISVMDEEHVTSLTNHQTESNDSMDHGIEVDDEGTMIREEIPDFRAQEEAQGKGKGQQMDAITTTTAASSETTTAMISTTMEQIQDGLSKLCAPNPFEETSNEKSLLKAWSLAPSAPKDIYGTHGMQQSSSSTSIASKMAKNSATSTESSQGDGEGKRKGRDDSNSDENNDDELLRGWSHEEEEGDRKDPTVGDMIRKAGVAVTGGALVVAGLPMIPMPTPGGVVVVGSGMALLATEFPAAQRAIEKSKEGLSNMVGEESDDEEVDEDTKRTREKASKVADLMFQDPEDKKAAERKKQQHAIAAASTNNNPAAINLDDLNEMKRKAAKAAQGTKRGLKKFIRGTVLPLMDKMTPNGERKKKDSPSKKEKEVKDNEPDLTSPRLRLGSKDMEKK